MRKQTTRFGWMIAASLLLAACGSAPTTPAPAPTVAPAATDAAPVATVAEATAAPEATEVATTEAMSDTTTVPVSDTTPAAAQVPPTINATFVCPDGTSIEVVFDNTADNATVTLPDGTVTLPHVEAASGAKYSDGKTTVWNKGNTIMVEVDGKTVYQDCATPDAPSESAPMTSTTAITTTTAATSTEAITSTEATTSATSSNAAPATINATFVCPDGTSIDVVFDNAAGNATVTLPDGAVTLPQVESGSGARYSDGKTAVWNKGNTIMVEVDGTTVYQDCATQ